MDTINKIKEQNIFQRLQMLMDYLDMSSEYLSVSQKNDIERIHITLSDAENKEIFPIVVKVMFLNDLNKALNKKMADGSPNTRDLLEFYIDYPVIIDEENVLSINVLLMKFNSLLPIGAFCVNEKNNVYFRYVLVTEQRDVTPTVFVEIVDMITFYLDIFGEEIISFYEKKQSLEQSIENGLKNMTNIIESIT